MEQYERDAREAAAKELEAYAYPHSARWIRDGKKKGDAATAMFEALLPLLATSDLERRALEACEALHNEYGTTYAHLSKTAQAVCDVGRESLAAKKPKGPWRAIGPVSIQSGRTHYAVHNGITGGMQFFDTAEAADERVREQNEREAAR